MREKENGRLSVMLSVAAPDGTTRFVDQITYGQASDIKFRYFSWRGALFGRYDVFHVHWPEFLIRGRTSIGTFCKAVLFFGLLLRLRILAIPVVRTLHNISPHEKPYELEFRLTNYLNSLVRLTVTLNEAIGISAVHGKVIVIPHGHYRDRFAQYRIPSPVSGRILFTGLIRPYKGVPELIKVFRRLSQDDWTLRLVGQATEGLKAEIESAASKDPRITYDLRFVPDNVLVTEIGHAELVVLPYREMYNSGVLLVALSLERPVLIPRTPANELIAQEVGGDWVNMFDGELTEAVLEESVFRARKLNGDCHPRLNRRDWESVSSAYRNAYWAVVSKRANTQAKL